MKGGYVCLGFQPINDSNQLNRFWMSCSSINQKECKTTLTFLNDVLSFGVPKPY
jgi:hypothetical protein